MSTEEDKFKHSKRLLKDENAIKKQVKIAKEHSHHNSEYNPKVDQPHRFAKHHAMDCGNPGCVLCGNPRKTWKELTAQEKRMFQETEILRMRHSNGISPDDSDE
jgi:hypothetical protein